MPKAEDLWNPKMSLGVDQIDDHHKELLRLLIEAKMIMEGEKDKIALKNVISQLVSYTKYHFTAEERLMAEHKYPSIKEHIEDHQNFLKVLEETFISISKLSTDLPTEMYLFLKNWYVEHILKKDIRIGLFIQHKNQS